MVICPLPADSGRLEHDLLQGIATGDDGIDDLADIGRDPDLVDLDASVRHCHFDDFGCRCPKRLDERYALPLPSPSGPFQSDISATVSGTLR